MNTFFKKRLSQTTLALSAITLLSLSQGASAVVFLTASDDGTDLTFTWSGTLDTSDGMGGTILTNSTDPTSIDIFGPTNGLSTGGGFMDTQVGTPVTLSLAVNPILNVPSTSSAPTFGYTGNQLYWDTALGASPTSISPIGSFTFAGQTVASVFGTILDNGPVTVWTFNATGDTIQITAVPEPSTLSLGAIAGLTLLARRRRRS